LARSNSSPQMALLFDEDANSGLDWVQECLRHLALQDNKSAFEVAQGSFLDACKTQNPRAKFSALHMMAKIHLVLGELHDASALAGRAQEALVDIPGDVVKLGGYIKRTLANLKCHLFKFREAVELVHEAISIFSDSGSKVGEAAALCTLAKIHLAAQRWPDALKAGKQSLMLYREGSEQLGEAESLETIVRISLSVGKHVEALQAANELLGIFQGGDDADREAIAMLLVAEVRAAMGELLEAEELATKVVERCGDAMDKRQQAHALVKLSQFSFSNNNYTDAWTYVKEARDLFASIGDRNGEAETLRCIAEAHITAGSFEEAGFIAEEGIMLCRSAGLRQALAKALLTIADGHIAEVTAGCPAARATHLNWVARKKGKEALVIFQELGDLRGQAKCEGVLAAAFLSYGNLMEGKARAKAAIRLCQEVGDKAGEGSNLLLVAQVRVHDNQEEALRLARAGEKLLREAGDPIRHQGAEQVVDYIRGLDGIEDGDREKGKAKSQAIKDEKSDITMDMEYDRIRAAYFHGFTSRTAKR